ncbi:hypothetical protein GC176_02115 [bacterium]|nr:hypothetical protein [bacterium]
MTATAEPATFDDLLPRLIDDYALPRGELTAAHSLADKANRLAPAFAALSENIWTALPATDFSGVSDHNELARTVSVSADILSAKQKDVRFFAESICFEAIELRVRGQHHPTAKADAIRSARGPLCNAVARVNRPLEPVLTADLMAQPLNEITPVVNHWFRQSCHTIAAQLLLSMHVLVELDVVGLIEWPGDTTCKLNFFRHVVTQDQLRCRRTEAVQRRTDEDGDLWMRFEAWEQVQGRNRYSIERHEHHVMNAEARRLDETRYPIPADKQAFLDQVPPWIRQHMRLLEGDLILERVIERDVREEQWETTPVLRSSYELEPAILLGHYVITGWGQREIDRENFRRKRIETHASQQPEKDDHKQRALAGRAYDSLKPWAMAVGSAAVAMMLFSRLQPAIMVPIAVLLTIAGIGLAGRSVASYSHWKHGVVDWLFAIAASLTVAGGLIAAQSLLYGIMFGRLPMIGMAAVLGVLAWIASAIAGSRN